MRALIVYEDSHRAYGEAMVGAVRASRLGLEEVALVHLRKLEAELERFDPHLVVSSDRTPSMQAAGRRRCCSQTIRTSHLRSASTGGTGGWRTPV